MTGKRLVVVPPVGEWSLKRERCFTALVRYLPGLSNRDIEEIVVGAERLQAAKAVLRRGNSPPYRRFDG